MAQPLKPPHEDGRRWGIPTISAILVLILVGVCVACCAAGKAIFPGGPF